MDAIGVYIFLITLGGVAHWQVGLLYPWIHVGRHTGRIETCDPVDFPWLIFGLLTPLAGLAALGGFLYAVWRRMHGPTPAQRTRMMVR